MYFPEMCDNSAYFEPTFTFMGFLYRRLDVRPPFAVEDSKVCCGYPPGLG